MRIYIDFDDVLCETARALSEIAKKVFKRDVPYEQITVFNLQHAFSLSGDEIGRLMDLAHEIEFLEKLDPAPGAVDALKLLQRKHDVVIVTGRPSFCHEGSVRWLNRYGLKDTEIIYVDKYGRAPKSVPDGTFPPMLTLDQFFQLSFDVAIDDSPEALDLLTRMEHCRIFIYNRPWNRGYQLTGNMIRLPGWDSILKQLSAATKLDSSI